MSHIFIEKLIDRHSEVAFCFEMRKSILCWIFILFTFVFFFIYKEADTY